MDRGGTHRLGLLWWILLCVLGSTVTAEQIPLSTSVNSPASRACHALKSYFPDLVSLPNDSRYQSQQLAYWASNQADYAPACRLSPATAGEVGRSISRLVALDDDNDGEDMSFAIRSGGHATAFGASNLDRGITLDLSAFNSVVLAEDHSYVDIGTAARWRDVYRALDPFELTVAGGRAASVGVGGYLLGGGISLFSSLYGWGADTIESIEFVLPNNTLLTASNTTHADLFACLKGGANNFGIATNFRLKTFQTHGPIHVALLRYAHAQLPELLAALANFTQHAHVDLYSASADLSVGFQTTQDARDPLDMVYLLMLTRIVPPDAVSVPEADEVPALWQPFFEIPTMSITCSRASMGQIAKMVEESNPYGFRVYKTTFTVANDPELVAQITDLFTTTMQQSNLTHASPVVQAGLLVQPLTLPHLHHASQHGGGARNLMGLETETEPLILLVLEIHYQPPSLAQAYIALLDEIRASAESLASARHALHPFRYVNYADAGQDVWETLRRRRGHGLDEVRRVLERYDEAGCWWRKVKGGFRF